MNKTLFTFRIVQMSFIMCVVAFLSIALAAQAESKAGKYEKYLAKSAAYIGTDMLVKDRSDAVGMSLVSAALKMDPDNDRALLTSMVIKKELELVATKHKYTKEDFVKKSVWRGKALYDKESGRYVGAKTLAMLYFSLAELLEKDNEVVLIYLEKLHREDDVPDLVDILEDDETAADWLKKVKKKKEEPKNTALRPRPEDLDPFWGVDRPMAELTKLYGKTVRTKYAPRSNGTLKYFTTPNGQVEAFLAKGKCVRVQFTLNRREFPTAEDRDAFVLKDRPGWKVVLEKPTVRGYENGNRTMAASITEAGTNLTFVAWSKKFYR